MSSIPPKNRGKSPGFTVNGNHAINDYNQNLVQGVPDLSDDLKEINPKLNNVLVFDDLMSPAIDSPVLSKLFTQGRYRNASVILLLQNMFPKGK